VVVAVGFSPHETSSTASKRNGSAIDILFLLIMLSSRNPSGRP
jgi:hypothetical protein